MNPYQRWCIKKAKLKISQVHPMMNGRHKVLDIGCGNGALTLLLKQRGHEITPSDRVNKSVFPEVVPVLCDGENLPFEDKSFDAALMITMLHHTKSPEKILKEAARVASRLIVMEEVYSNWFQKQLTFFIDSAVNGEFIGHPHTNKTDIEWRDHFEKQGYSLIAAERRTFLLFFTQYTYVIEV